MLKLHFGFGGILGVCNIFYTESVFLQQIALGYVLGLGPFSKKLFIILFLFVHLIDLHVAQCCLCNE